MTQLSYLNRPHFDHGAISQIGEVLATLGVSRPLICTDKGLVQVGVLDQLRGVMPNTVQYDVFDGTPPNPTQKAVEEAINQYREQGCDSLIALGGGSSMDLAKAVGILAKQDGTIDQFSIQQGGIEKIKAIAPIVAIPTTSGTGSEVSNGSVIIMDDGQKLILANPLLIPAAAICDPDLTLGLPPVLTAGAGMDAVTHCMEAIMSPQINPPAEAVGYDGLDRAVGGGSLLEAVQDGKSKKARWNMMMTSTEGAMAFTKGLGLVHCMSHAIGAYNSHMHHGTLNGLILPTILRFNHGLDESMNDKFARMRRTMGLAPNADLAEAIEQLNADIGLAANLSDYGLSDDNLDALVAHAKNDVCLFTSPRQPASDDEWYKLYTDAMAI